MARLSPAEIQDRYVSRCKPVVLAGAIRDWKAYRDWSLEYLVKRIGHHQVIVSESDGVFAWDPQKGPLYANQMMTFREFTQKVSLPKSKHRVHYLQAGALGGELRALLRDVKVPIDGANATHPKAAARLWVGSGGNVVMLHYDPSHGFLAQVRGTKRIRLFPPEQSSFLYHCRLDAKNPGTMYSLIRDIDNVDEAVYPAFREARPVVAILKPGDMLFIPRLWWHHVESTGLNIAVSFPSGKHDKIHKLMALLWTVIARLPPTERRQTTALFAEFADTYRALPPDYLAFCNSLLTSVFAQTMEEPTSRRSSV